MPTSLADQQPNSGEMVVKRILFAAAALGALSVTAYASDLPSRAGPPVFVPPPAIPAFSWTGLYAGGQVGYEFGRDHSIYTTTTPGLTPIDGVIFPQGAVFAAAAVEEPVFGPGGTTVTNASTSPHGVAGGGHVGYLFSTQSLPVFSGFLGAGGVIGIEGDIDGADYSSSSIYSDGALVAGGVRSRIQGSVRGRLGVAFDRLLVYATGGAAFAEFQVTIPDADGDPYKYSRDRVGYTVGGGIEYAFTNNLSARIEYRYSDYGTFTGAIVAPPADLATTVVTTHHETTNLVQIGLSYHFTTPAAVVARY